VCIAARQASVRVFAVPPVWIHIFQYAQDAELGARIRRQLNRDESRHALARRLFFANQGTFRVGDRDEIMNKVTALSLLSNAVLVWNSVRCLCKAP